MMHYATLAFEAQQQLCQAPFLVVIQTSGGLVQQDDLWAAHQDSRQRSPLLLAATQISRISLGQACQTQALQQGKVCARVRRQPPAAPGEGKFGGQGLAEKELSRMLGTYPTTRHTSLTSTRRVSIPATMI